jgi:hypothetical protein
VRIKNINPLGDVEDLLIGRVVAAGEVVEVSDEVAKDRIATGNYEAAEADKKKG